MRKNRRKSASRKQPLFKVADRMFKYSVVQLERDGFHSVRAPWQSSDMQGQETQKATLNSFMHHKAPGDFQATNQFFFIFTFLLNTEVTFSATYSELEEFSRRLKPSQIPRELVNDWYLSITCNSMLCYPDSSSENNFKIKYILRF